MYYLECQKRKDNIMREHKKHEVTLESGTYIANGGTVYYLKVFSRKLKMTVKTFQEMSTNGENLKEKLLKSAKQWASENDYIISIIY